jgi:hypothetical protein
MGLILILNKIYIYMHICVCVYIYIYTHTHTHSYYISLPTFSQLWPSLFGPHMLLEQLEVHCCLYRTEWSR